MLAMIVVLLVMIGAVSIVSYNVNNLTVATVRLSQTIEEQRQLDTWQQAISSRVAVSSNGYYSVLAGDDISGYRGLPNSIPLPLKNVWGIPYVWCPYGGASGTNGSSTTITMPSTATYTAYTETINGASYVEESPSRPAFEGILGFILSPLPYAAVKPDCTHVSRSDGKYIVTRDNGGAIEDLALVRPITEHPEIYQLNNTDFIYENVTLSGGENVGTKYFSAWNSLQAERSTYEFSAASYDVGVNSTFSNSYFGTKKAVRLTSDTGTSTLSSSGYISISFDGVDVFIEDLSIADTIRLVVKNGNLILKNSNTGPIDIFNGSILIQGSSTASIGTTDPNQVNSIIMRNSKLSIGDGDALQVKGLSLLGSDVNINLGTLTSISTSNNPRGITLINGSRVIAFNAFINSTTTLVGTSYGFTLENSCSLAFYNSTVTLTDNDYGFINYGSMDLVATNVNFVNGAATGVFLGSGGQLNLSSASRFGHNSDSAQRPDYAVYDAGALSVSGDAEIYAVTTCWGGSGAGIATQFGHALQDASNKSSWTCN